MKRVLFISIIIIAAVLLFVLNKKNTEQFNCYNCGRNDWTVGPSRCLSCYNCGWCEKRDGSGSCKVSNPDGSGPLFAEDCYKCYQGGRRTLYYTYYPWYNPLRWIYWRWPQIRGVPYLSRRPALYPRRRRLRRRFLRR